MADIDIRDLAQYSDEFAETCDFYLTEHNELGDAVDAAITKEEVEEQHRLLMERSIEWGGDPAVKWPGGDEELASIILTFNENAARLVLRTADFATIQTACVKPEHRTEEISKSFGARHCPKLALLFKP